MKAKWTLLIIALSLNFRLLEAKGSAAQASLSINDTVMVDVFMGSALGSVDGYIRPTGWFGKMYVSSEGSIGLAAGIGFWANAYCHIYIFPGDTISKLNLNGTEFRNICDTGMYSSGSFWDEENNAVARVDFMPDALLGYYHTHFDAIYMDSVQAHADSLASITFYEMSNVAVIYPNPTTDKLYFTDLYEKAGEVQIALYAINGQEVLHQNFETNSGIQSKYIDLSLLQNGVYLVSYQSEEKRIVKRIVKM